MTTAAAAADDSWRYFNNCLPSLNQKFNSKNAKNQTFSFPTPIITYISTKSCVLFHSNVPKPSAFHVGIKRSVRNCAGTTKNPKVILVGVIPTCFQYFALPKLLKTCKYFLIKFKTIPIKSCSIENDNLILGGYNSIATYKYCAKEFLSKITKYNLRLGFSDTIFLLSERPSSLGLSLIMEKTSFLVIRKLRLRGQHLTFNEFTFLTSSPLLFDIIFDASFIWLNDKTILPVENIIQKLPTVGMFDYIERGWNVITAFTPYTLQQVGLLKRTQKFNRFWLSQIPPQKDVEIPILLNFVTENSFAEYQKNTFTFKFNEKVDKHSKCVLMEEFAKISINFSNIDVTIL